MSRFRHLRLLAALLLAPAMIQGAGAQALGPATPATPPVPALAPPPAGAGPTLPAFVPAPLRGAWFVGECAAPDAMLQLTARGAAVLPDGAPVRVIRFAEARQQEGWLVGTGRGAEAPRILLRAQGSALQTAEPEAKLRDDLLPGPTPLRNWQRCPSPPAGFMALHGEGLAFLSSLEVLEGACGGGAPPAACAAAILAEGDVSGDRLLSPAEIARMARGAAWLLAAAEGATPEALLTAVGGAMLGGVALGRFAVEGLDYDGDGKLSLTELGQDRASFPRGGSEAGRPLRLEGVQEGLGLVRSLLEGIIFGE